MRSRLAFRHKQAPISTEGLCIVGRYSSRSLVTRTRTLLYRFRESGGNRTRQPLFCLERMQSSLQQQQQVAQPRGTGACCKKKHSTRLKQTCGPSNTTCIRQRLALVGWVIDGFPMVFPSHASSPWASFISSRPPHLVFFVSTAFDNNRFRSSPRGG